MSLRTSGNNSAGRQETLRGSYGSANCELRKTALRHVKVGETKLNVPPCSALLKPETSPNQRYLKHLLALIFVGSIKHQNYDLGGKKLLGMIQLICKTEGKVLTDCSVPYMKRVGPAQSKPLQKQSRGRALCPWFYTDDLSPTWV